MLVLLYKERDSNTIDISTIRMTSTTIDVIPTTIRLCTLYYTPISHTVLLYSKDKASYTL